MAKKKVCNDRTRDKGCVQIKVHADNEETPHMCVLI